LDQGVDECRGLGRVDEPVGCTNSIRREWRTGSVGEADAGQVPATDWQ
jgi:hypothetical protein